MNNDLKTTIAGVVAGIASILTVFNIVLPEWLSGLIVALAVAALGYFTNKKDKPFG